MSAPEPITARDGETLAVRHWPATSAQSETPRASLLIIPGLGEHGGRYERAAGILASSGLDTWALDLRGFGASGGRRAYVERLDVWLDDVADRLAGLRELGWPVVLLGHSMGGLVCAAYAESDRPQPDLLVLSAPAIAGNVPAWKQVLARILGNVTPSLAVKNAIDGSILSRDPAVGVDYVADPLNVHTTTARLGAVLLNAQAPTIAAIGRIRVPTLVIHGGADHLVPTASSEVFEGRPGVERRLYPGLAHETFNEPEGPQVVADVAAWIEAHLPTG
ncbi:MAG TPA: lysophospholipase [Candidatus Limnocylindrales bacterium]|nr:lysophospholipase [Candidatus Limnocylindrales bacterium]